jgi:pimeloyl-ACP methyl ester carboxylesterase
MAKASITGVFLADILARTRDQEFILMGHSLGARVVYYTLQALATKKQQIVRDAYLLGGAVGVGDDDAWLSATTAVKNIIHNCYSRKDIVLTCLYQGGNALMSKPVGIRPIKTQSDKIRNWDYSELIGGHSEWKTRLPQVLDRITKDF